MTKKEENREELGRTIVGWIELIKNLPIGLIVSLMVFSSLTTMGAFAWKDYQQPAEIHFIPAEPTPTSAPTATPEPISVFINGEVLNPGIYQLPFDSRVQTLLDQAGGFTALAFTEGFNLAQPLVDGMHVHIPSTDSNQEAVVVPLISTPPSTAKEESGVTGGLVNLNRASKSELESLPGVGPSTAQKILDYREDNGLFSAIEDVMDVSGIGPAKFEQMAEFLTVDG